MDLLTKEYLIWIKEAGYPRPKSMSTGQIWYDTETKQHGIVIGHVLYFIKGGFTVISDFDINSSQYIYQPTIQDLILFTPGINVSLWGGEFCARIKDNEHRYLASNPLQVCAMAYLSLFIKP